MPISNTPDRADLQAAAAEVSASLIATFGSGGTVPMTMPGGAR
jgi:hypothetical protein